MMMPFRINLSSRYREYVGLARIVLVLIAAVLVVAIVWDLQQAVTLSGQASQMEPAVARVRAQDRYFVEQARGENVDLSDAALKRLPKEVGFANKLIAERTFSWTKLLGELEETVPPGLAINGVQHDLGKTVTIRLSGSATDLEIITAFTLALGTHPAFYDPELVQHRVRERTGLVEFDLRVGHRGEAS